MSKSINLLLLLVTGFFAVNCFAQTSLEWKINIDRLANETISIDDIELSNSRDAENPPAVSLETSVIHINESKIELGPLRVACPGGTLAVIEQRCANSDWTLTVDQEYPQISGTLQSFMSETEFMALTLDGQVDELTWSADIQISDMTSRVLLQIPSQDLSDLTFLESFIGAWSWIYGGQLAGEILLTKGVQESPVLESHIQFKGVDFDSPDGLYAAAGVDVSVSAFTNDLSSGSLNVESEISGGELLLLDFYRDFTDRSLNLSAKPVLNANHLEVPRFEISDGDSLSIVGQIHLPLTSEMNEPELILREFSFEFPLAYRRYFESPATVYGLDGLETSGSIHWAGDWTPGTARRGVLEIRDLSVNDAKNGRFNIEGLEGQLQTNSETRLNWQLISFEKMNLGSGDAGISLTPESVSITEPIIVDVLGGHLDLEKLAISVSDKGEPDVQVQASVNDIDMLQMSRALGWPEFAGTLSGRIPGVRWRGGVIEIDGALDFEVFDGDLLLTDLRIERPFGVLPSMAANITASNLDLEELTQTFEFGRIGGRADGYVRDLRMLNWQPVQFDAWFGTPENDDERHGISRQAVQHLTAIGGGGATAMLSGPVLRLFNNFSYRRLGLGCELRNNVCNIRGIENQGEAVLLMEGAGIPKISIQAFNRSVDWPQLLAELTAVSSGQEIRIGE